LRKTAEGGMADRRALEALEPERFAVFGHVK
jgi:hypothetical protein